MMKNSLRGLLLLLFTGLWLGGVAQSPSRSGLAVQNQLIQTSASPAIQSSRQLASYNALDYGVQGRLLSGLNVGTSNSPTTAATATCGPDTVLYPTAKTTGFRGLNMADSLAFGQWYDAPQAITVSGFSFYAWLDSATNQSINLTCQLYNAGPDSLPLGAPLASTTVSVDSNFYNGNLGLLEKHATFTNPVVVTGPYVVVVQNLTGIAAATISNDFGAAPPDGGSEWIGHVFLSGNWLHGYQINLGGTPFNADFLFHPHVTYELTAAFQPNPAFGCTGIAATMLNNSSPIIFSRFYNQAAFIGQPELSFTWNYGDGSALDNVVDGNHVYTLAGPFTVTLLDSIFGWNVNCTDQTTGPIAISTGTQTMASFNFSTTGSSATFTDATSGSPVAWFWDFGDGNTSTQQSPSHTYTNPGSYTVCLIAANNCNADTVCQSLLIGAPPAGGCDTITNFTGTPALFTNPGGGYVAGHNSFADSAKAEKFSLGGAFAFDEILYFFGAKESPTPATSKVIATVWDATGSNGSPGAVLATQDVFFNQIDTTGAPTVVTFPAPIATNGDFFVGIQLIQSPGDTVGLLTNSQGQTTPATAWELFSGGTSWVPYDDANSWGLSVSHAIFVVQTVEAGFTSTVAGQTAGFQDMSAGATGWLWDFGDGNASTQQNPTHTYANPGTYNVCQVVFSGTCTDTICSNVTVAGGCPPPSSIWSFTNTGQTFNFTDLSTSNATITSWFWDFGDGNSSLQQNPTHTYANAGNYLVCLVVLDSCGADSSCQTVTAGCPLPAAGFTSVTSGLTVAFSDASTGTPTTWFWDFGDGTTSTLQNPVHTYTTQGTFNVCLTVTNACGSNTFCNGINTGCNTPIASFGFQQTGLLDVDFTDQSTAFPTGWLWNFGDGNTSTATNPTHTYTMAGTYTVCLTVTNSCGTNTTCQTITVTCPAPSAAFTSSATGTSASFTDQSTGGATGWLWDFGDGNSSTQQNPNHTYSTGGTFTVCLIAGNACGGDTICQPITVVCPAPSAAFSFSSTNLAYSFNDLTSGSPTSWMWDFGDGNTSTQQNPNHLYSNLGTFQVCLIATNSCGPDTFCTSVTVTCPTPTANFSLNANNLTVDFSDMSTGAPTGWQWIFGDGSGFSIQQNPTYTYAAPGTYTVCLVTVNSCGTDTSCSTITLSCPAPAADFNFMTVGNQVDFTDLSASGTTDWSWDFGDGTTSTVPSPSHSYSAVGTYTVCLIAGNQCGADTFCQAVIINCVPPSAGFSSSTSNDSIVAFSNQSSSNSTAWNWSFGDGAISTDIQPTHTYAGPGTYTVCLTVTNSCGTNTFCDSVTITCINPTAGYTAQVTNSEAVFSDVSLNSVDYFWDFGDGTTSTLANPTHTYSATGIYQVCQTVTNFCTSNTTCQNLVITCNPPATNFSFQNGTTMVDFTDQTANQPTQWLWDFGDGGTDTVANPTHGFLFAGMFNVCLTTWNACGRSDTCMMVNVTAVDVQDQVALQNSFELYPNPNNGRFTLEAVLPKAQDVRIRVTNLLGQELMAWEVGKVQGEFQKEIVTDQLAVGTYLLEMQAGPNRVHRKLIIE